MNELSHDDGIIVVLLERLEKRRLPRLLAMNEQLDAGKPLDDMELEYLEEVIEDARRALPLFERHPEYQELALKVIGLYSEISEKALELEKSS